MMLLLSWEKINLIVISSFFINNIVETKTSFSNSYKDYYGGIIIAKKTTSSPNDDVAVAVAGEDVAVLIEGDTSNVPGLISVLEDAHAFIQHAAVVQGPKGHMSFSTGDDLVTFQRMPLGANHRVDGALQSTFISR